VRCSLFAALRLKKRGDSEELNLWKCQLFTPKEELFHFLDEGGSLAIELKLSIYVHVDLETVVGVGADASTALKEFGGEKRLLDKLASLLGDSETSDSTLSVVDEEDKEIAEFHCHSAILSGSNSNSD